MFLLMLSLFLITWITNTNGVHSAKMPVDLPLDIEDGNWLIKAKLTANLRGLSSQIKIDEYIKSVNGTIRGKVVAKAGDKNSRSIYYSNANQYERLYVSGGYCQHFLYRNGWNYYISGLVNDLVNHLVLVGPSIVFRINKLNPVWTPDNDDLVRGVMHHSVKTTLETYFKVWFYYKGNDLEGLRRPSRIKIIGYDPYSRYTEDDTYQFDYYTIARVDQNFDTIVTPEPGLFCDKYFSKTITNFVIPFPKLTQPTIHFIAKTKSSNAGPPEKEEVYADEKYQISRIKSSTFDKDNKSITTDVIYDYQLGLAYEFTEGGKCSVSPMDLSAPGIIQDSSLGYVNYKLDLNHLLDFDLNYRYLGPVLFENRDEIGIHAWEIYHKNTKLGEKDFPNVIRTQYFSELKNGRIGYTLVGTTLKAHDSDKNVIASQTTSYFNYGYEISTSDRMEKFGPKDCYSSPKDKKTIAFFFVCEDTHCDSLGQYYYKIQDAIEEALINTRIISASRISNIEPIFDSKEIIIYVTFLDFPNIKNAFKMQNMKLAAKTLMTESRVMVDGDEETCLRTNSYKYEPFESIAFCRTENGNVCQRIDGKKVKLIEDKDKGTACSVFMTPLKNIYRYSRESPLDDIHEKLAHIEITFVSPNNDKVFKLTPYQVIDVTKPIEEYIPMYEKIIQNTKLIEDKVNTIQVGTIDLSSCRRKCVIAAENDCSSFSFCTYPDRVECFVSTISNVSSEKMSRDSSCGTYFIESLTKYEKIPSKKFADIEKSVSLEVPLGKCASFCSETESCKSFQYCSGSCSLAGYYTDTSSVRSDSCDIYIPNVLNRFELTGNFIVEELFHTEINLNADQCAALCHDWNDNDVICKSFNYCPTHGKTPSFCHLSKYSSQDTTVKLIHSDTCRNYERTNQKMIKQENTESISKLTHSGSIYWIIVLFVTTGLISGIIVPVAYSHFFSVKSNASEIYNRNTFSWTKQLNDERQSVNSGETLHISSDCAVPGSE